MADTSLMYWQEKLGKTQPRVLKFAWEITGAKAVSSLVAGIPVLTAFDAVASQTVIDDHLGTTNEFLVAAFDATSQGTDAFSVIVNLGKQAEKLLFAKASVHSGTNGLTLVESAAKSSSALTASTLASECAKGANGNLAAKFVLTGVDALTSGVIVVELAWISK